MSPEYMRAIIAGAGAPTASTQGRAKFVNGQFVLPDDRPKKGGRGGPATAFISEGTGTGGAMIGAGIGTAILPGIGTAIGAGLGGLAGALSGRLAENKIRDDEFRAGDALKEGLLTGGLSAAFPGAGLVKNALKGGANATTTAATRTGLERTSQSLLGKATGIRSGVKLGGEAVTPQRAADLQKFVATTVKAPKGANADRLFEHLVNYQDDAGKAISSSITASPARVKTSAVASTLESKFGKVIGGNAEASPVAQDILGQLKKAKTPTDLWELRKGIDDAVNFNRNAQSPIPGIEQFGRTARTEVNKLLKSTVPEYDGLASNYSKATDAISLVSAAARTPRGANLPGFLGRVGGEQVQSLRSVAGRAVGGAASAPRSLGSALSRIPQPARMPLAANTLSAGLRQSPNNTDTTNMMPMNQNMVDNSMTMDELSADYDAKSIPEQSSDSPFDPSNVDTNIQSILANGGDMKDVGQYVSLVEALQKLRSGPATKPVKKTEGQRARDEAAALTDEALSQLEAGSVNTGLVSGKLEGLKATLGRGDPETLAFNTTVSSLKAAIAKARAGTSFTPNEEKMLNRYAPSVGDSGQQLRTKLRALQQIYAQAAEREYGIEYADTPVPLTSANY